MSCGKHILNRIFKNLHIVCNFLSHYFTISLCGEIRDRKTAKTLISVYTDPKKLDHNSNDWRSVFS